MAGCSPGRAPGNVLAPPSDWMHGAVMGQAPPPWDGGRPASHAACTIASAWTQRRFSRAAVSCRGRKGLLRTPLAPFLHPCFALLASRHCPVDPRAAPKRLIFFKDVPEPSRGAESPGRCADPRPVVVMWCDRRKERLRPGRGMPRGHGGRVRVLVDPRERDRGAETETRRVDRHGGQKYFFVGKVCWRGVLI